MRPWFSVFAASLLFLLALPSRDNADVEASPSLRRVPIERMPPGAFPGLPRRITRALEARGCTIPQEWQDPKSADYRKPNNVIRGSFRKRGQTDWAVLCSRADSSGIVIFWGGKPDHPTEMGRSRDADWTQLIDERGNVVFSRLLLVASPRRILRDNPNPGVAIPLHDGIEDYFDGKASSIYYFEKGRLLELMGAD
jgi:hypothetical protein